jgi:hypothetical protein
MTRVVNLRHEEYDVLIARPSKWGNPFQIGRDGSREQVITMYEIHLRRRPDLLASLPELAGKRLGCHCKPEACHGDVLVKLLREMNLSYYNCIGPLRRSKFWPVTFITAGHLTIPCNSSSPPT